MTLFQATLALHIASGAGALAVGLVAMAVSKKSPVHPRLGRVYHWLVFAVCATSVVMAILDWNRIWWFLPIGTGSYALALLGFLAAKRRWRHWLRWHISGFGGSYIAMVTALLVVNWHNLTGTPGIGAPLAWALPTIVGSPLIAWVNRRVRKRGIR